MKAVIGDLMSTGPNLSDHIRIHSGIICRDKKGCLDILNIQHIQNAGDPLLGAVCAFRHMDKMPGVHAVRF